MVVLPDPDSPMMPNESFLNNSKFILFNIFFPPRFKLRLLTLSISELVLLKFILLIRSFLFNDIKFFVYLFFGFLKILAVSPSSIISPSFKKIIYLQVGKIIMNNKSLFIGINSRSPL